MRPAAVRRYYSLFSADALAGWTGQKRRDCWSGRIGAYGRQIWSCFGRGGHGSQPILEETGDDGKRLGADYFYATSEPEISPNLKGHFDLIINTVSANMDWNQYLNRAERRRLHGHCRHAGESRFPSRLFLLLRRRSLAGSAIGGIRETQEMLDFCGKHNITSDIELTPIQNVNELSIGFSRATCAIAS